MDIEKLVKDIQAEPDGPRRRQLEERYWALAVEKHGPTRARWYRDEYEWLRRHAELSTSVVST